MNTGTIYLQPARRLRTEGARRGSAPGPAAAAARQAVYAPAYGQTCAAGRRDAPLPNAVLSPACGQARPTRPEVRRGYASQGPGVVPAARNIRPARLRKKARARRHALRRLLAFLLLALGLGGFWVLRCLAPGLAVWPAKPQPMPDSRPLELLMQRPLLPNGCEAASTAMLLNWAGAPAAMDELFFEYFPHKSFVSTGGDRFGPDPETAYAGDASSEQGGWYCFEGAAAEGANAFLAARGSPYRARALHGLAREALGEYLDAGVPLAMWVTRGYEEPRFSSSFSWVLPDGSRYIPYANLHCVVLAGRAENGLLRIADPLEGWQTVEPETFWQSFEAMGGRAVAIG